MMDKRLYDPNWNSDKICYRRADEHPPVKPMYQAEWLGTRVKAIGTVTPVHPMAPQEGFKGWIPTPLGRARAAAAKVHSERGRSSSPRRSVGTSARV